MSDSQPAAWTDELHDWVTSFTGLDTRAEPNQPTDTGVVLTAAVEGGDPPSEEPEEGRGRQATTGGRDPPAEELEEGEGRNRDGSVRRKGGDHGRFRGSDAKSDQDKAFRDAVRDYKLTKKQARKLHDEISGQNLDPETIRKLAEEMAENDDGIEENPEEDGPEPEDLDDPEGESSRGSEQEQGSKKESLRNFLIRLGISAEAAAIIILLLELGGVVVLAEMRRQGCTEDQVKAVAANYGWQDDQASA